MTDPKFLLRLTNAMLKAERQSLNLTAAGSTQPEAEYDGIFYDDLMAASKSNHQSTTIHLVRDTDLYPLQPQTFTYLTQQYRKRAGQKFRLYFDFDNTLTVAARAFLEAQSIREDAYLTAVFGSTDRQRSLATLLSSVHVDDLHVVTANPALQTIRSTLSRLVGFTAPWNVHYVVGTKNKIEFVEKFHKHVKGRTWQGRYYGARS